MPSSVSRTKNKLFYGWVLVIAFFVISTFSYGTRFSFGVFFKSIAGEFDLTRVLTSGIHSALMVLGTVFSFLGGWASDRYGPKIAILVMGTFIGLSLLLTSQASSAWQLFITYSLLLAIGTAGVYPALMSTTSRWFDKKRGLALGITTAGAGLGPVVTAPLAAYLISNFSWRMAYIVLGLIAGLVTISLSILIKREPSDIGALPDGVQPNSPVNGSQNGRENTQPAGLLLKQALRTRSFWLLGTIWPLQALCLHLVLTHIVPHATDVDISDTTAAGILSLTGGISIAGRILMGWISDKIGTKISVAMCALIQVVMMLGLIYSQELWMFYLFAVFFGFSWGGLAPTFFALISETVGLRSLGTIGGTLAIGWNIGAAIGPLMGGYVFDVRNDYSLAFLGGAVAMLIFILFLPGIRREINRNI